MLEPAILAALVALVKLIADTYFPQFPVSEELINAVILILLGLFGLESIKSTARHFAPSAFERGLLKDE